MAYLVPAAANQIALIRQLESTDAAQGGVGAVMNLQGQAIANSLAYLQGISGNFENVTEILSSAGVTHNFTIAELTRSLILMAQDTDNYLTGNLPYATGFAIGATINISRLITGVTAKPVAITCFAGDEFIDITGATPTTIYLHAGESVCFTKSAGGLWRIMNFSGSYYNVGDQAFNLAVKPGTLKRDGSTYNRADYPRLWSWAFANGLTVSDATWTSNPGGALCPFPYKSLFSQGDGLTTFKVPDDRGLFDRAMDYGAGIDADRVAASLQTTPGSKEADNFATHLHIFTGTPHTHTFAGAPHSHAVNATIVAKSGASDKWGVLDPMFDATYGSDLLPSGGVIVDATAGGTNANATAGGINDNTGGSETRGINTAKHPLIVY